MKDTIIQNVITGDRATAMMLTDEEVAIVERHRVRRGMSQELAERHIVAICEWLESGGDMNGQDLATVSRRWSKELLSSADVETLGGCPLCQG